MGSCYSTKLEGVEAGKRTGCGAGRWHLDLKANTEKYR